MLKSVVYTVIPGYVNIRYTSSAQDCGFEPCSGQIKEYKIGIYANSVIFQLYHGENKLIFNENMFRSTLY
jgi:hypothetical protein